MRFQGIANPAQLKILNQAFDQHCISRRISDPVGRDELATSILKLFSRGIVSLEEIDRALAAPADQDTLLQA